MFEKRDASEQRALSEKCGSYTLLGVCWIPIVRTPKKTKIMYFPKKSDNVQAFVNLHICPIMFFCRLYTFFTKSLFDFIFS